MNNYQQQILTQNQQLQYQLQHQQHLQQLQMQRLMMQQQQQQQQPNHINTNNNNQVLMMQHQPHQQQQQQFHQLQHHQQQTSTTTTTTYYTDDAHDIPLLMAVRIMDGLFVGNAMAAQDDDFLFSNKVSHIVNCAGLEAANVFNDSGIEYLTFPWRDVATTQILDSQDRNISRITKFIEKAFDRGECILVHSLHGISRSCVVVAAFLIFKYGWTLEQSLSYMHIAHPDMRIQTYFVRQLKLLSKRRARALDTSDPRDLALREQTVLLKHTYMNSMSPSEEELATFPVSYPRHNKRVFFDGSEHVLGPRSSTMNDTRPPRKKSILKIPSNFVPPPLDVPSILLDVAQSNEKSSPTTSATTVSQASDSQNRVRGSNTSQSLSSTKPEESKTGVSSVDPRQRQMDVIRSSTESIDQSAQLIISDAPAQKSTMMMMMNPSAPDVPSPMTAPLISSRQDVQQQQQQSDQQSNQSLRKRPTSFSSSSNSGSGNNSSSTNQSTTTRESKSSDLLQLPLTPSAPPKPHAVPQPRKFRDPTPPKRNQTGPSNSNNNNNGTAKRDNTSTTTTRNSVNFNPTQYNYQPPPQDQEPLFLKVNRKASSVDVEKRSSVVRSSTVNSTGGGGGSGNGSGGYSSVLQGTVSSNLKRGSGAGIENVQLRKRPSSAPKTRPLTEITTSNPLSVRSGTIPTLQSIHGEPSASSSSTSSSSSSSLPSSNRPLSAPTSNSLNSPRKKKKKKASPAKKEPVENRLMRPTLSFLRKTVGKSK